MCATRMQCLCLVINSFKFFAEKIQLQFFPAALLATTLLETFCGGFTVEKGNQR